MRVYVSGPMTGYEDYNRPLFQYVTRSLREAGWDVVCPTENGLPDDSPWTDHMREDIAQLVTCDRVATLPGWSKSRGARLEVHVARRLGMRVDRWDTIGNAP